MLTILVGVEAVLINWQIFIISVNYVLSPLSFFFFFFTSIRPLTFLRVLPGIVLNPQTHEGSKSPPCTQENRQRKPHQMEGPSQSYGANVV